MPRADHPSAILKELTAKISTMRCGDCAGIRYVVLFNSDPLRYAVRFSSAIRTIAQRQCSLCGAVAKNKAGKCRACGSNEFDEAEQHVCARCGSPIDGVIYCRSEPPAGFVGSTGR